MQFDISSNIDRAAAGLNDLRMKLPSIVARTLTKTAQAAQADFKGKLPRLLDRPTPWTLNSTLVRQAEKNNLQAAVGLKWQRGGADLSGFVSKPAPVAMRKQVYGGPGRTLKKTEEKLASFGMMPQGWYMVPAVAVKRDQYGNVSTGQLNRILYTGVSFGANSRRGSLKKAINTQFAPFSQTAKKKNSPFFVKYQDTYSKTGPIGIYERTGLYSSKPLFYFKSSVKYKKRVDFHRIIGAFSARNWQHHYKESVAVVRLKMQMG